MNLKKNFFLLLKKKKNIFSSPQELMPKSEKKEIKKNLIKIIKQSNPQKLSLSKSNSLKITRNKTSMKNSTIDVYLSNNSNNIKNNSLINYSSNDQIKFANDKYKTIISCKKHNCRRKSIGKTQKKFLSKGFKLANSIFNNNNIFSKSPLLINQKQIIDYNTNIQEKKENQSEMNSYQKELNDLKENNNIQKEEIINQSKEDCEINENENKINLNNEETEENKEIKVNSNKSQYQNFISKTRKSDFLINNKKLRKKLSFDSILYKKKLLIPEIVPNKNKQIKEDEKDTNEKLIFLNENYENNSLINKYNNVERRKNKSMTLIKNPIYKFQSYKLSSLRNERRHNTLIILKKNNENNNNINIEETYYYFKNVNENLKDFVKTTKSEKFKDVIKKVLKNYNNKKIQIDQINMYNDLKNLRFKIEANKIKPKLKKYPNIQLSSYFQEKLKEQIELDNKIQNFEKKYLEILAKNKLKNHN